MNQCDNLQNVQMIKGSSGNIVTEKESKHSPGSRLWMGTVIYLCEWEHLLIFFSDKKKENICQFRDDILGSQDCINMFW